MKTMKNRILAAIIIASSLFAVSCEDDFEPKIYGSLFTTNFPKTESDFEAYMMACYIPFSVNWAYNFTGVNQHNFYVAEGGIVRLFDVTSDISNAWEIGTWGGSWTLLSKASYTDCVYYGRGSGGNPSHFEKVRDISRFTQIIGDIQKTNLLSDSKKKAMEGEAKLLRGLMMYYLLHIYGPVPVILDPALVGNIEAEKNLERPTLEQMAKWITEDFEYAVANMPKTQPKGRYTADYARFCLMRHCLNEDRIWLEYDKAIAMYNELKLRDTVCSAMEERCYANQFKQANNLMLK